VFRRRPGSPKSEYRVAESLGAKGLVRSMTSMFSQFQGLSRFSGTLASGGGGPWAHKITRFNAGAGCHGYKRGQRGFRIVFFQGIAAASNSARAPSFTARWLLPGGYGCAFAERCGPSAGGVFSHG